MDLNPNKVVELIKASLKGKGVDYEKIIEEFGQVRTVRKRLEGKKFTLQEYIKGLIYALLTDQQKWNIIVPHLEELNKIFYFYGSEKLVQADPEKLKEKVMEIKCGNKKISRQMESLRDNIDTLKQIIPLMENDMKVMFNELTDLEKIQEGIENWAIKLYKFNSPYKLKGIGKALVWEFFKNIGIRSIKPDTHILRICGKKRLNILPHIEDENTQNNQKLLEAQKVFMEFARQVSNDDPAMMVYLDNLFWIFGADGYGNICSKEPHCNECHLREYCCHK